MKPIVNVNEIITDGADPVLVWEAVVNTAVRHRVSDIHATVQKDGYELAFRIDGDMHQQGTFPREFGRRLLGHVKTMADIDLGVTRRPAEGRMKAPLSGRQIDLRVSVVPTIHGQDLVVRLFDSTISLMALTELGLLKDQLDHLRDMAARPSGMILVSGPSGGGKTTTLYAILREIAGGDRKIVTIEDPVEYDLPHVNQTQVNPRIGVNFAVMLKAILRQDPDVIMVGEIRDEETAVTAVRAAITGHLVLATTHATRASRAIETVLSLGVHPYFLATGLRCVIAQVLAKRICPHCKTALPETADMLMEERILQRLPKGTPAQLFQGTGCEHCYGTGYRGRVGLFELFLADDRIRRMIQERRGAADIDAAAAGSDQLTLDQVGKLAAVTGVTSMEEVVSILPTI